MSRRGRRGAPQRARTGVALAGDGHSSVAVVRQSVLPHALEAVVTLHEDAEALALGLVHSAHVTAIGRGECHSARAGVVREAVFKVALESLALSSDE